MIVPILLLLFLAIAYLPSWWVRRVMARHHEPKERYPGTGAELIHHLSERLGLEALKVERTGPGQDHYDPSSATIRLSPDNHDGRSLTAITVAAHELGHAIQHADGMALFQWRQRLVRLAQPFQRLGVGLIMVAPILAMLLRSPGIMLWGVVAGLGCMLILALTHLITLPVEVDASFGRALPLLEKGDYLHPEDQSSARQILQAAALTYVAQSLGALLNLGIWLRILRP
ncbi:Zn-dependent membrane protease YugP [Natronospira proteinivora]|uniref:Zn-dependent membrane protease YugP n=1 Tax=Natronospira proteinivora TaxID=1807133 RepID=A0ABT1G5G3_9GAMM|nr:zinc metallopeptidase [Natronospira proteinivora]MCP1726525.1 Zn-dependent membrane protease YugP [Natronospira proteinivora]